MAWDNEPLSCITHFFGFLLAIAGLVLMVVFAAHSGNSWHIVSYSIFGATLVLLYLASAVYHFIPKSSGAKRILRKIDRSMIYALIAGTYTPICLVTLRGAWGWTLFGLVWGIAIIGILLSALKINLSRPFYVALY
ncbi:MAG: hemolysin III family protein, partial [Candidatus Woesearchaeota archaeon]